MMKEQIESIEIQEQTIGQWINYFKTYSKKTDLHVVYYPSGYIMIKCCFNYREEKQNHKLKTPNIYQEIYFGYFNDFEIFINSFKFFGTIYRGG